MVIRDDGMENLDEVILSLHRDKMLDLEHRWVNALQQLNDDDLNWRPNDLSNSIANLVVHIAGNFRQRFVSGIGGEPDNRDRNEEFNTRQRFTKQELVNILTEHFAIVHRSMLNMTSQMLTQVYNIQGRDVSGLDVIFGVATHVSEHLGQVLFIAKLRLGEEYQIQVLPHERK